MTVENVYQENMQVYAAVSKTQQNSSTYPTVFIQREEKTNWWPLKIKLILILREAKLLKQSVLSMSETIFL